MSLFKDIRDSVKDSIIYSFGNLSTKLVGFVLIPLYTQYLSVEDYAILAILEISAQFMVAVFGVRISSALLRLYWDKEFVNKQKSMFFTSLSFLTAISIISMACFIYFSETFSILLFDTPKFAYPLTLMLISSGLQIIVLLCLTQIRIKEKPILFSISNISRLIVTLLLTVYFITYQNKNIEAIYEAQLIGFIAFFLTILRFIIKNIKIRIDFQILRSMLTYSYPLILAEVAGVVFTITSRYCLNFISTLHEVGIYSLGFKVANTLKVFIVSSVMLALSPMIFKKMNDPDCKLFYSKIMTYFAFGLMLFVLAISLFGKEVIHMLSKNSDYWGAHTVIPILSFAIFFDMLKDISLTGLHITKRTKIISAMISIVAIINLILNIIFIFFWQSIGAALATLMAQILFFIIIFKAAQRYYLIHYEIIKIVKILLVGILIFAITFYLDPLNLAVRVSIKLALIFLFPIILYFWNFFEEIELLRMKQSWQKWRNIRNWRK